MRVAVFSAKSYDREFLTQRCSEHELVFFEPHLEESTAQLAAGFPAVCVFVNDTCSAPVLSQLARAGTKLLVLRCAGFNQVDLQCADELGMTVARVPAYDPAAVAEHAVALMMTLSRHTHRAYNRVREGNFALQGLLGFTFREKTCGLVGTGRIGLALARIMLGLGCKVVAYDPAPSEAGAKLGIDFVSFEELTARSDIISLHCPLNPATHHLINANSIARMKRGVMLINTSRGAVMDTKALISGLKNGQIGYLGLDVYEQEADLFFEDLSDHVIQDDLFQRLTTFSNVLITGHQGFFTREALCQIADVTANNLNRFEAGLPLEETRLDYKIHHSAATAPTPG